MNNINKRPNSQLHSNQFHGVYTQVKEIEKNMEAALQLLAVTYQTSLSKVKQSTERALQAIHAFQQQAMIKLDALKDQLIESVESRWTQFKQYSRLVRRACLGEQSNISMDMPDLQGLQNAITNIYSHVDSLQGIADRVSSKLPQIEQYIIKNLDNCWESESLQAGIDKIEKNFVEISPIKQKAKHGNQQSNLKIKQFSTVQLLVQQMRQNPKQRKVKTETANQLAQSDHIYANSVAKDYLSQKAGMPQLIQPEYTSMSISRSRPIQAKRVVPQMPIHHPLKTLEIPKITGTGRLQRFGTTKVNQVEEFKAGSPRSFTRRNKQLMFPLQKREDVLVSSGQDYKNCLQKLQRQQLEYEKLRRGLA